MVTRSAPSIEVTHRTVRVATPAGPLAVHLAEAGPAGAPPVLLLHGWPQHWWCWRKVVPLLAEDHRLLMPDLRGLGWTEAPGHGYDPETFAADAVALLDALGLERVDVIGHDWGGFTTYLLALAHPDRVRRAVVCAAPHPWAPLDAGAVAGLWRTWYVNAVASPLGPRIVGSRRFLPWFLRLGGRGDLFDGSEAATYATVLREPARAQASSQLYRSYLRVAWSIFAGRRFDDRRLTVPARVLFGTEDFYIPVANTLGVEERGDDVELRLVEGASHWLPEEHPELVASAARALFDGG